MLKPPLIKEKKFSFDLFYQMRAKFGFFVCDGQLNAISLKHTGKFYKNGDPKG